MFIQYRPATYCLKKNKNEPKLKTQIPKHNSIENELLSF